MRAQVADRELRPPTCEFRSPIVRAYPGPTAAAPASQDKEIRQFMPLPEGVRMRFDHISIAVKSIDETESFFARYFPIVARSDRTESIQLTGSFFWKDFYLGGFPIELIEDPAGTEGFITRFIGKHGEGFHHLSIEVNHLAPVLERMRAEGVRIVDEQKFESGSRTAFVSPRSAFGTIIQFWEVPDYDQPRAKPKDDRRSRLDHASVAVRDINRAVGFFQRYFSTRMIRPKGMSGSSSDFMLAQIDVAGLKLEFIQAPPKSTASNDFVGRFIERYGQGLHHIALEIEDFDGALKKLKADGVRVVDERVNRHGRRQFFISPRSAFGTLIQVWDGVREGASARELQD
jgi:methylmalonyl-CoA/ethylmalonyl-CoA epimerase